MPYQSINGQALVLLAVLMLGGCLAAIGNGYDLWIGIVAGFILFAAACTLQTFYHSVRQRRQLPTQT